MSLEIQSTEATLGAVVRGVKIAALDAAEWRAIEAAFHEHAVLIFPDQHPSRDEQVAFGRRFGELDSLVAQTGTVPISNRLPSGALLDDGHPVKQVLRGNEGWHTDSSYMPVSARASLLSAEVVTEHGGETEWADMRAAYDALDEATRRRIAGLSAHHSLYHSQAAIGHVVTTGAGYGFHTKGAPLRPLVKVHPVTSRPALFIGRHAYGIPGLPEAESEKLLADLVDFACRPPRTYAHSWRPGDVVIWDNRCVLHRARPYDYGQVRVMRHTRVAGDPASELAGTDRDARAEAYEPSASNR
jgi:alpha-ketoglutarate-dependent taurine dioxygenase